MIVARPKDNSGFGFLSYCTRPLIVTALPININQDFYLWNLFVKYLSLSRLYLFTDAKLAKLSKE